LYGLHEDHRCRAAGRPRHQAPARRPQLGEPAMAVVTREQETQFSVIGKRNPKIEAHQKASGQTKYAGDIKLPRMAWARLLRSSHPHARIVSIDTTRAEVYPGVFAVVTGADMPATIGIMPTSQDEHPLAIGKV